MIDEIECCNKFKELEYLNLAVNNVKTIKGLRRCESLRKFDLTLNFIDVENIKESMEELEWNPYISELYIMGNPCLDWPDCKDYIIAMCPSINRLDGIEITRGVKLAAKNKLQKMVKDLDELAAQSIAKKEWEKKEGIFHKDKYSPEVRW